MSSAKNVQIGDFVRHQYYDWFGLVVNIEQIPTKNNVFGYLVQAHKILTVFLEPTTHIANWRPVSPIRTLELSQWRFIPSSKVDQFLQQKQKQGIIETF